MAQYTESASLRRADFLYIRAFCTVIFHTVLLPFVALMVLGIARNMIQAEHPLLFAKPADPHALGTQVAIWAAVGFSVGIGKAISYSSEAQKLLSAAEQEKHLRFIATQLQNRPRIHDGPEYHK